MNNFSLLFSIVMMLASNTLFAQNEFLKTIGKDRCPQYVEELYQLGNNKEVDCATFTEMGDAYAKDKNNIYFAMEANLYAGYIKVQEADSNTFEALNEDYGKDTRHVFFRYSVIKNVNPETFEILPSSYSKDKQHVYFENTLLENADASSFKVIKWEYPAQFIVYPLVKSKNASPNSLSLLANNFRCEHYQERDNDALIPQIIFAPLINSNKHYYAKDKNNVYYDGILVTGADPATFQPTSSREAHDKNKTYLLGVPKPK